MRIIGGKAGGIRLEAPESSALRPTEDRVKESLFGTLGDLRGVCVVDLFSGTGALGLEALSRGASAVYFVERNPVHLAFLERNLAAVRKSIGAGVGETHIFSRDVQACHSLLQGISGQVDLVLADPPYHASADCPYCGMELLRDPAFAAWTRPGTLLCLEHGSDMEMPWSPETPWRLLKQKIFGIRQLSFARRVLDSGNAPEES